MKAPSQQQDSCCLHRQIAAACFLSRDNLVHYLHLPSLQCHWCQWHSGCSGDSSALTFQPHSQLIKQSSYFSATVYPLKCFFIFHHTLSDAKEIQICGCIPNSNKNRAFLCYCSITKGLSYGLQKESSQFCGQKEMQ